MTARQEESVWALGLAAAHRVQLGRVSACAAWTQGLYTLWLPPAPLLQHLPACLLPVAPFCPPTHFAAALWGFSCTDAGADD